MISLSNIVYGYYVQEDETDRVVINSNKLFGERMEKLQREREKAAEAAFEASAPEVRTEPVLDEEGNPVLDKDGNPVTQEVRIPAEPDSSISSEEILQGAEQEAESIRSQAHMDADAIRDRANADAQLAKNQGYEEGRNEGYQSGVMQAQDEYNQKLEELNQRQLEIENDYHERLAAMEGELTNVILSVVDHVFHSQIAGKREIVMHLIEDAISHSNASNEFQIHLCPQDALHFREMKEELMQRLPGEVKLDLIEDALLSPGDCTIETDGGIFDCSVDTEFDALLRDIRSLSRKE